MVEKGRRGLPYDRPRGGVHIGPVLLLLMMMMLKMLIMLMMLVMLK